MTRQEIALEMLKKVMDRNRKVELDDKRIALMVETAYASMDEFLKLENK